MPKSPGLYLVIIALVVRVVAIITLPNDIGGSDRAEYLALAQNIKLHGVFSFGGPHLWGYDPPLNSHGPFEPTAARAPLYPLLIASLWWSEAPPVLEVQVAQVLFGTVVVLLTYSLALRLLSQRAAIVAGFLIAFSPLSCCFVANIMSETLFTFLLISGVWLWARQEGLAAGVLFGAAALTRPIVLPFIVLIALSGVTLKFNRRTHVMIVLGAVLLVAPWTIRNFVALHMLIPIQTQGWGSNLLFGTIDVPYGSSGSPWKLYGADPGAHAVISSASSETDAESKMLRLAVDRILSDPVRWFWIRVKEFPRLFEDPGIYLFQATPFSPIIVKYVILIFGFLFVGLSLFGAYLARLQWKHFYVIATFPIFLCLTEFPAFGEVRYIIPILPMLAIFAAIPLSGTTSSLKSALDSNILIE
jgi:4-amino-4-deoxy-L-arabinose transferase-like glycosyltransferase